MRYDMPLNWNDETIPSEADKTTDILGFKEIGGIGQLIYHPFRFKKYELDIDKSDDYCATPFCRPGYEPIFPKEDFLSGQGLLTSLCNLAMQINSFDNKIPYTQLIMEWCTNNMHPYNIDFIYSELNESFDINSFDAEMVEKDGTFEIHNFLDDLGKLYNAVMFYVALEGICIADDEAAYDLSKEGKYFEGYSFFDKYKHPIVAIPDDLDYGDAKGNLIEEMRIDNEYIKNHPAEKPPTGEFATTPYDDYDELRNALIDIIPEFTMCSACCNKYIGISHTSLLQQTFRPINSSVLCIKLITCFYQFIIQPVQILYSRIQMFMPQCLTDHFQFPSCLLSHICKIVT